MKTAERTPFETSVRFPMDSDKSLMISPSERVTQERATQEKEMSKRENVVKENVKKENRERDCKRKKIVKNKQPTTG